MESAGLLADAYERIRKLVVNGVDHLSEKQLAWRPDREANSIGWLIWHLTRIQDDHVSAAAHRQQEYEAGGWHRRLGLPYDPSSTGYGHTADEVGQISGVSAQDLLAYYDAVHERSIQFLRGLTDTDLDRLVDKSFDPPVTLGARLVSVLSDNLQHGGQAAYVKGMLQRGQIG